MKKFRFHLSTLLFFCVLAGAGIGLYLRPDHWKAEYFVDLRQHAYDGYYNLAAEMQRDPVLGTLKIDYVNNLWPEFAETADRLERADGRKEKDTIVIYQVDAKTGAETVVDRLKISSTHPFLHYTQDESRLVAMTFSQAFLFRRNRPYGILGWFYLPLTWIALLSFSGLCADLLRQRRALALKSKTLS